MTATRMRFLAIAAATALFAPQATAYQIPAHQVVDPIAGRVLLVHNQARAALGLGPVVWDHALAAGAAGWAQYMAATGRFDHSDRKARPGVGENLWRGTRRAYSIEAMVGMWVAERRHFVPGIFPANSRTGNWFDVSHYTQIIWPTTRRVGCAIASGRGHDYLVCRYSPKGNVDGRAVGFELPQIGPVERGL